MNITCSICLESFTSKCNVSTTTCGHVFHTDCIEEWLKNGQNNCSQCRKTCHQNQLIQLYFSENDTESGLVSELEQEIWILQQEHFKSFPEAGEVSGAPGCL